MEHPDLALIIRDWMTYRNTNYLYKIPMSKALNQWPDIRKNIIKPHFKHLKKSTVNAWKEVTEIYISHIKPIAQNITTVDGTYTNWAILKSDSRSCIYNCTLNNVPAIVKTYLSVDKNHFATNENKISQALDEMGFNVPNRYESFNTDHHLCIPMQKLDTTLLDMYKKDPVGIGLQNVKAIVRDFVPILKTLHEEYKLCYVDFSCGNVAFHNNQPYMIDYGALHPTCGGPPCMKTLRYESINATNGNPVTFLDDLQSLGFVITEALYGPNMCGEGSLFSTKPLLIENALQGTMGQFLQSYFTALESDNPYDASLALC